MCVWVVCFVLSCEGKCFNAVLTSWVHFLGNIMARSVVYKKVQYFTYLSPVFIVYKRWHYCHNSVNLKNHTSTVFPFWSICCPYIFIFERLRLLFLMFPVQRSTSLLGGPFLQSSYFSILTQGQFFPQLFDLIFTHSTHHNSLLFWPQQNCPVLHPPRRSLLHIRTKYNQENT